ncbi:hypothetical protein LOK49_LG14G00243 [Camellia lanceoleosa]|uniref:Uncharacterized protein n=1 Tax=Camellia lanceoleosa TaxID=1840588 RepID=A0ACC0FA18_9ERIC|nr:hypothetical protein LOK49_LG14G00243 [Camellia lanceoleosa]
MSSSSIGGGKGQMLRFMSKKCCCGRKATIRIVESEKPSKGRLYYVCENAGLGVVISGLGATQLDMLPSMEEIRLMMRSQELRKVCSLMED